MKSQLTVSQALAEGFEYYGKDGRDFQHLHKLTDITPDYFHDGETLILAEKEAQYTTIDAKDLADLLADHMDSTHGDETGDDTSEVYEAIKAIDFSETAKKINDVMKTRWYRKLTDIQLIPDPVVTPTE